MMLRVDQEKALPKFLLYQWLSPRIQEEQLAPMMKGSASPHLNIKFVRRFGLLLLPLPEQRRIVAYLDDLQAKVDSLKALQAQSAAEFDGLLPSILDKAFKGEL
jgi:type I restriction enzyme S subunit